jgi:hypothetical protein
VSRSGLLPTIGSRPRWRGPNYLMLPHIVRGGRPPTVAETANQQWPDRPGWPGVFEPSLAYQRCFLRRIEWKGSRHALCSDNRLGPPDGRLAGVIRDSRQQVTILPTCEDRRMPLNVGGGTIGAANSQQKTDTDTFAIIRTGAWVSGIMNPTTASTCKGGRTKRSRTLETIENRRAAGRPSARPATAGSRRQDTGLPDDPGKIRLHRHATGVASNTGIGGVMIPPLISE